MLLLYLGVREDVVGFAILRGKVKVIADSLYYKVSKECRIVISYHGEARTSPNHFYMMNSILLSSSHKTSSHQSPAKNCTYQAQPLGSITKMVSRTKRIQYLIFTLNGD